VIVDVIVSSVVGLFTALLSLIPEWEVPESSVEIANGVGQFMGVLNKFLPLDDFFIVLGLGLAFAAAVTVWHFIVWAYERIPFKAS
jgi:hypothetical protein